MAHQMAQARARSRGSGKCAHVSEVGGTADPRKGPLTGAPTASADPRRAQGSTEADSRPCDGPSSETVPREVVEDSGEAGPVGCVCLDSEAVVRSVNAAAAALLGVEPGQPLGRPFSTFVIDDASGRLTNGQLELIATGSARVHHVRLHDGRGTEVSATAVALADRSAMRGDIRYRIILMPRDYDGAPQSALLAERDEACTNHDADVERLRLGVQALAEQLVGERLRVSQLVRSNVQQALLPLLMRLRERCERDQGPVFDALERGLRDLESGFATRLAEGGFGLTSRELEICHMLREGLSSKEISQSLSLSPQSVDTHRRNIRRKLRLTNQSQPLADRLRQLDVEELSSA